MKGQDADSVKIFENHIPNKRLGSGIHKVLSKFNNKKISL